MADTILYSQANLDDIIARLNSVQHALESVRGTLAGVDTSGRAGGDLDVSAVGGMVACHLIGGVITGSTVRERVRSFERRVDDYADYVGRLASAVGKVGAEFDSVEKGLQTETEPASPPVGIVDLIRSWINRISTLPIIPAVVNPTRLIQNLLIPNNLLTDFVPQIMQLPNMVLPGLILHAVTGQIGSFLQEPGAWVGNFLLDSGNTSGAMASWELSSADGENTVSGDLMGWSWKTKTGGSESTSGNMASSKWTAKDGWTDTSDKTKTTIGVEKSVTAEGHLAKITSTREHGLRKDTSSITIGGGSVTGSIGSTIWKDGKFDPNIGAKVKGELFVLKAETSKQVGFEHLNVTTSGEMKVLGAEGNAGVTLTNEGLEASIGGEAYIVKGSAGKTVNILGIKIGVSGEAMLGVNASAKLKVGAESEGTVGLGPVKVKVNVDVSDFLSNAKKAVNTVKSFYILANG